MASPTSSEFSHVIDWTEAMEQCGDDEDFLRELLSDLRGEIDEQIVKMDEVLKVRGGAGYNFQIGDLIRCCPRGGGIEACILSMGNTRLDQVSGICYFCRVGRGFADRMFPALVILPITNSEFSFSRRILHNHTHISKESHQRAIISTCHARRTRN